MSNGSQTQETRLPTGPHSGWQHLTRNLSRILPTQLARAHLVRREATAQLLQALRRR